MALTLEQHADLVEQEIGRLAQVATGADPATPVPTCGSWTLADLLRHTGEVYRWAALIVRESAQARPPRESLDFGVPDRPDDLPAWIAEGAAATAGTFRTCDPTVALWSWGWPKAAGFWPRRMVHEVGVHRADAELALGIEPAFDPLVADDGVDELLGNLLHAAYFAAHVRELRGDGEVLGFAATDSGTSWRVTFGPDGFTWERAVLDGGRLDARVDATSRDLYLGLWGRPADLVVAGDEALFHRWATNSSL